jgi:carbon storage regulator
MLVLSRRINEEIIIAGGIRVTVVSVKGDRVRIGVAAPPEVSVDRAEVHARRMQFFDLPASSVSDSCVDFGARPDGDVPEPKIAFGERGRDLR